MSMTPQADQNSDNSMADEPVILDEVDFEDEAHDTPIDQAISDVEMNEPPTSLIPMRITIRNESSKAQIEEENDKDCEIAASPCHNRDERPNNSLQSNDGPKSALSKWYLGSEKYENWYCPCSRNFDRVIISDSHLKVFARKNELIQGTSISAFGGAGRVH